MSASEIASTPAAETDPLASPEARLYSIPSLCVFAFLIGLVAATGAVIFRYLISIVHNIFYYGTFSLYYDANQFEAPSSFGALIILAPVIGGLIVVFLVKTFAPEAKGHGVPEVMFAIYHNKGNVRGVVAIVKSLASAISIGSGASVGREGPIIQIGASFGSTLARTLHMVRWQKITLLSAGAGAGIAATFNTPLGGVLFAVEMLLPEVSSRTFLPVVVATATATYVARIALGLDPAFIVPIAALQPHQAVDTVQLLAYAVLGGCAGVASWAFVKFLAWCEDIFPMLPGNEYTQNVVGMLMIGCLSYAFFVTTGHYHTAGVGYATIQDILNGTPYTFILLAVLLLAKIAATSISLGSGASGGVFSPSLFIGATLGGAIGVVGALLFPEHGFSPAEFALVGMGALVGGATGASMTAIVMIFEMTRDYNVIVPLVLAVAIAVGVRRSLISANIYTIKLRNRGKPIPSMRHTNMYLVRQAKELMAKNFMILPVETPLTEVVAKLSACGARHVIASDGTRIAGFARFGTIPYAPDRDCGQTLRDIMSTDYVIAPQTNILNSVIARMNQRDRSYAIIIEGDPGVPRPDDVVGVIDTSEIASAVVANHYA
ncbi:CIC family chloride channel protein [Breoghania corrubedonensis]|uniref:CIC family chloride channel protein n=1 Tax=Breoghania corrubedonensis TaxID=665038 RepID=A0A2T5V4X3_9HYPH|nr:chloride channel protein [Breoghania corrubedonensis]PTW58783.1 CIC family chloride channel protein [Breoghania corrubedonensis]